MRKKPGTLERIDKARTESMIASFATSLGAKHKSPSLEQILNPGAREVAQFTDDELHSVLAREPTTTLGSLAASELRKRESWRTPSKWALYISLASFVLAFVAFVRTL